MCAPHVHGGDVVAPDLDELDVAPALVYPVDDPLGDARLPDLEPPPQPDTDPLQPPQLVPRQRELRRGRRGRRDRIPAAPPAAARCVRLAVARGPAGVERGADAVAGELGRGGHEDLPGGRGARARGRSGGGFEVAEAPELVGDAAERGLGEELRLCRGADGRQAGAAVAGLGGGDGER